MTIDPDPALLEELERFAVDQARFSGRLALERFRAGIVNVEYKGRDRRDPVTEVDREVEDRFRSAIAQRFPSHAVLGEERSGKDGHSNIVWVIDPVDGTVNFASGLPVFAVSIGALFEGLPVVGAIYVTQPSIDGAVVHARKDAGCFRDGARLSAYDGSDLHPSRPSALPAAFWRRFSLGQKLRWSPIEVRTLGSIAYELTLIAGGNLQFGIYRAPKIWDVAAGVLLVQEAKGAVYEWMGGGWLPFRRFTASGSPLRDWSRPLFLGGADIAGRVTNSIRPRTGLKARLWPIAWRLFGG